MKQVFTIPGKLPGANDYIRACRAHKNAAASMKKQAQETIGWCIKAAKLKPMTGRVDVRFRWVEPNMKRDKDNIRFGAKFILDALVEQKMLINDGWTYIGNLSDEYFVNGSDPRIVVELEEA